jgi:hypothetical protein
MNRFGSFRLLLTVAVVMTWFVGFTPAAAETITLSGIITEVKSTPPAPFSGVAVDDTWTLSYTFNVEGINDVDPSDDAGQYRNLNLTIRDSIVVLSYS